jgi:hypothetical protein
MMGIKKKHPSFSVDFKNPNMYASKRVTGTGILEKPHFPLKNY